MKKQRIIAPFMLILLSAALIIWVVVLTNTKSDIDAVKRIVLEGNAYHDLKSYLSFIGNDSLNTAKMCVPELRKKMLSHPYIRNAAVTTPEPGVALVSVTEKRMKSLVLAGGAEYYITEFDEIISKRNGTAPIDVPVLQLDTRNGRALTGGQIKKIQRAVVFLNATCVDSLNFAGDVSEIILKDDGVMFVSLKSLKPFFIMNDKNIEREAAYMLSFLRLRGEYESILGACTYLDLRLKQKIIAVSDAGGGA